MNPAWSDAQNWLDILDHVWIGLVVIMAAVIPSVFAARNHKNIQKVSEQVSGVSAQVINGHADAPPLRADLDRAINAIEQLGRDMQGMRKDLVSEEERRRQQINDLRDDVDRYMQNRKR